MTHRIDDWRGLYSEGWQGEITPDAFSHPAKFSRALIRAIYDHAAAEGWLAAGDMVVDPFGGVGLGGIDAMRLGCHWIGCELEQKFVDLGRANIELWESRYRAHFPAWGTARLLQGDSRQLAQHLAGAAPGQLGAMPEGDHGAALAVSSPPYADSVNSQGHGIDWTKVDPASTGGRRRGEDSKHGQTLRDQLAYGRTIGQLGAMKEGDHGAALSVASPPYSEGCRQQGSDRHPGRMDGTAFTPARYDLAVSSPPFGAAETRDRTSYMAVSSPPYEGSLDHAPGNKNWNAEPTETQARQGNTGYCGNVLKQDAYSDAPGQLGGDKGDDFWTAARAIIEQTHQALRPGGHAIWVVKAFVRNGKRVDFPGQWRALCEAVGFVTLHEHRAWLVEERGTQIDLFGNHHTKTVERKSFFRRLAESKGSPRIDWETVYCMVKPD